MFIRLISIARFWVDNSFLQIRHGQLFATDYTNYQIPLRVNDKSKNRTSISGPCSNQKRWSPWVVLSKTIEKALDLVFECFCLF